jgi:DNA uptake protein ComE-like DNA-binding protein
MIVTTPSAAARAASLPLVLLALACGGGADRAADSAADSAGVAAAPSTSVPNPAAPPGQVAAGAPNVTDSVGGEAAHQGALLDPNTATREQLAAVPGMPGHLVDALVAGRPYADMLAVDKALTAHQPDSAARKALYARVWKPLDLNSAKGEEILLIPGVGRRMRHEFEEYRPYKNMEQFRREIGKYVDKNEVARLERYVTIK